jgi:hypothetical protein
MASVTLCQRTFSKLIFVPTNTSGLELTCTDSSGNTINCNYVHVQFSPSAIAAGQNATLFIEPSGNLSYTQNVSSIANTSLSAATGSGAGGFVLVGAFGEASSYEYVCLPTESFNKIILRNIHMGGSVAITFGLVTSINNLRLSDKYLYTKGS